MQTGEVNISFIHDIETSLFITQLIQHVYVMYLALVTSTIVGMEVFTSYKV